MSETGTRLFGSNDAPLDTLPSGLKRRKHARSPEIDLTEYFYESGMTPGDGTHAHTFSTAVFIVSGKFKLEYGGESHTLSRGDSYVAMVGQEHKVTCLESGSYVVAKPAESSSQQTSESHPQHQSHDHAHGHDHAH